MTWPLVVADPAVMTQKSAKKITEKQKEFARQFLVLNDASAAYRASYDVRSMSAAAISVAASRLLADPIVQEFVAQRRERAAFKFEVTEQMILELWWKIATADPNALIRHRRVCCRFCHGDDHAYQWRDEAELVQAITAEELLAKVDDREPNIPDPSGGFGFIASAEPAAECPRCAGEGLGDVFVSDTDKLEGSARILYAGVKQTRDGIEIKMRDQDAAAANIARYLGMFHDRMPGKANGNPIPPAAVLLAKTPSEAAKLYKEIMG